jgi:hypothetical protein
VPQGQGAGIVGTYDHAELLPQRREALQWWSEELARILSGEHEKRTDDALVSRTDH